MQSLKDMLLKAGLVSEDAAKKVEAEKAEAAAKSAAAQAARHQQREDRPPREDRPRRDDRGPGGPPRREFDRPRGDKGPPRANGAPPTAHRKFERPARPPRDEAPIHVPKLPPLPGSKEAQRLEARKQLELDRAIRELVTAAEVPQDVGATVFYFVTRKGKLRRLTLVQEQAKLIEEGKLAVVERPDPGAIEHSLVPPEAAEKLLALSPKSVRFFNKPGAGVGFLTEEEISRRQSEADEPAAKPAAAAAAPATDAAPTSDAPATFVTIKRAPIPTE